MSTWSTKNTFDSVGRNKYLWYLIAEKNRSVPTMFAERRDFWDTFVLFYFSKTKKEFRFKKFAVTLHTRSKEKANHEGLFLVVFRSKVTEIVV